MSGKIPATSPARFPAIKKEKSKMGEVFFGASE
jgi:hypothetical protein